METITTPVWSAGKPTATRLTVKEIAEKITGIVHGDESRVLCAIKPLETATIKDLSFLSPTSKKQHLELLSLAKVTKAGAVLLSKLEESIATTQIVAPHPLAAVIRLSSIFHPPPELITGIHPSAIIDATATLGKNVSIGAYTVIGRDVCIGANSVIHPQVVIYPGAVIGGNCIIHSGAVIREFVRLGNDCVIQNGVIIGGDGFGYIPDKEIGHRRIPHTGIVVIQDHVDVGANSTIDRGTYGETHLQDSTKVDNLVMIGHNVKVGTRSLLCGQVGISGSCTIGNNVTLAGQVGVADHLTIGDNARIAAAAGVTRNVAADTDVAGYPAIEINLWRRQHVLLKKLPEIFQRLRKFEKLFLMLIFLGCFATQIACSKNAPEAEMKNLTKPPTRLEEDLFEDAMKLYDKGSYSLSREAWSELRDGYPASYYATLAELKIADAYFFSDNFTEAQVAYEEFFRLHPAHEAAAYVRYQIGNCQLQLFTGELRDHQPLTSAIENFKLVLEKYPESVYAPLARRAIDQCKEKLASYEASVSKFYQKLGYAKASAKRVVTLKTQFPDSKAAIESSEQALGDNADPDDVSKTMLQKELQSQKKSLVPGAVVPLPKMPEIIITRP